MRALRNPGLADLDPLRRHRDVLANRMALVLRSMSRDENRLCAGLPAQAEMNLGFVFELIQRKAQVPRKAEDSPYSSGLAAGAKPEG